MRPCGIVKRANNNAYTRDELIVLLLEKIERGEVNMTPARARSLKLRELCLAVGIGEDGNPLVRAASPRAASPRAASPRAASPRAASPRAASPRAASPRAASPRAASPRAASPRAAKPKSTRSKKESKRAVRKLDKEKSEKVCGQKTKEHPNVYTKAELVKRAVREMGMDRKDAMKMTHEVLCSLFNYPYVGKEKEKKEKKKTVKDYVKEAGLDVNASPDDMFKRAVEQNMPEFLEVLLKESKRRITLLAISNGYINACKNGFDEIIRLIINNELISPEHLYNIGIRLASQNGHLSVVQLLLQYPSLNPGDKENQAIILASQNGHLPVVEALLQDRRVNPGDKKNEAIILASGNGHFPVVEALLKDRRVNAGDNENRAIIIASQNGHLPVVEALLRDPNVSPPDIRSGFSAVSQASQNGHLPVVEALLQDPRVNPHIAIITASQNGHLPVVQRLLQDDRVNPNQYNHLAIIAAVRNGHLPVIEALLQDRRVRDVVKRLAIDEAIKANKINIVKHLAPQIGVDYIGLCVFNAVKEGNYQMVEFLAPLTELDDIDTKNIIFAAILGGHDKILDFFLNKYEISENVRRDALKYATQKNRAGRIIDLLVKNRGDVVETLRHFNVQPENRDYHTPQRTQELEQKQDRGEKCETCFDLYAGDVNMNQYLKVELEDDTMDDDGNDMTDEKREELLKKRIVLFVGEKIDNLTPYSTTLSYLLNNIHNSLYTADCKKNPLTGQYALTSSGSEMKDVIFRLQLAGRYSFYLKNLLDVLENTDSRVFVMLPLLDGAGKRLEVERTAGIAQVGQVARMDESGYYGHSALIGDHLINYVSADHCQEGTDMKMYGIYACEGQGDNLLYPVCQE